MSWREIALGEAIRVKHGYAFKGDFFAPNGSHLVVTPGNFLESGGLRVREGKERFYVGDIPEDFVLVKDDLIVAMTEQGEGLLGSSAWIPEDDFFLHNQRIGLISQCDETVLHKRYLYWLFNTPNIRSQIRASATGAKVKHTAPERLYKVRVSIPDIAEQQRITALLDDVDENQAVLQKQISLLEEAARLIYTEWFIRLRFPDHKRKSPAWPAKPLNTIADINAESIGKQTHFDTLLYVDISSVSPGLIEQKIEYPLPDAPGRAKRLVAHGDIIWSCVRPNRRSHALILNPEENLVVSTGFATIRPKAVPWTYLYLAVTTDAFVAYLESHTQGAAYPAVTGRDFEKAEILLPPPEILEQFDLVVKPIFEQIEALKNQIEKLRQARDLLLPRLISGQLRL